MSYEDIGLQSPVVPGQIICVPDEQLGRAQTIPRKLEDEGRLIVSPVMESHLEGVAGGEAWEESIAGCR